MRLVVAACLLGVLGLAAPASAAKTVHVTGRVVDGSGRPVRGALVSFELRPDRELYDQANCDVRTWEIQCRVHKVAGRTDAAGRYRLPVKLDSFLATMRRHHVLVTDAPRAGVKVPAQTEVSVYFQRTPISLPDLPVWRGRASVTPNADGSRTVHVDGLGARYGTPYGAGPTVTLLQGSTPVWTFAGVTEDREIDGRLVEHGTDAVRATDVRILQRFFTTYWSPVHAVSGGVRPLSRGAACFTYGRDDAVVPLGRPCRFTDGRLGSPIAVTYQRAGTKACEVRSQCAQPKRVVVDLGSPQQVGSVLVRGCTPGTFEVSAEGTVYAPYEMRDLREDGLAEGVPLPVRYVRVDLSRCAYKATEIAVFSPSTLV